VVVVAAAAATVLMVVGVVAKTFISIEASRQCI
jgi:hypothetical protein